MNHDFHYNPEDLLPITDQSSGKFFDFALKTGHPLITDYSRIDKEIIVENNVISFGNRKVKKQIRSIADLEKVISNLISLVYTAQHNLNAYVMREGMPFVEFSHCNPNEEDMRLLTHQIILDILYDKYRDESQRLTLNEYCTNFINHDWDNSIYNALESENPGITLAFYDEFFKAVPKEFTKEEYESSIVAKEIADEVTTDEGENLKDNYIELLSFIEKYHYKLAENTNACLQECFKKYLGDMYDELVKKKKAAYNAMIEEIDREFKIMSDPVLKDDAGRLGVEPDLFLKYFTTLNKPGKKDEKKPKHIWDYLYYSGCPDLITSKQYRRNFIRDSNTSYSRFINDFNRYDSFIETILPKTAADDDVAEDVVYYHKSMNYYHLEIYKRLDYIYKLAVKIEGTALNNIDKEHFLVKRFHPLVMWPSMDIKNNYPIYDDKNKYYRPLPFLEILWLEKNQLDHIKNYDISTEYNIVRAKAYELFNYNYKFVSNDYNDITNFIRNHYNMQSYHEKNKEWTYTENKEKYRKKRIENVVMINKALFGKRKMNDENLNEKQK